MAWTPEPEDVNMEAVMTIGSHAMEEPRVAARRSLLSRARTPLVDAVARAPLSVRTKLLVGFAAIAVLLLVVGVLGIVALRQSNARVRRLSDLQARAATYHGLQSDVAQIEGQLLQRADVTPDAGTPLGRGTRLAPTSFFVLDATISQTLTSFLGDATGLE
ncbi:MAG TPA: Tar ligand binding domain-containing protein, partial [Gaiellaceae bacterium]|nr:Tar ligand binding domain-containing protein [Gaiellaceae bacterium]